MSKDRRRFFISRRFLNFEASTHIFEENEDSICARSPEADIYDVDAHRHYSKTAMCRSETVWRLSHYSRQRSQKIV